MSGVSKGSPGTFGRAPASNPIMTARLKRDYSALSDGELARLLAARDVGAVRLVTSRNNQRLFRAAWSILKDRSDAEDAVQAAYLRCFASIDGFRGQASLSTWLTRIAINEALGRLRTRRRRQARFDPDAVVDLTEYREKLMGGPVHSSAPDAELALTQVRSLLERAIGELPEAFRLVFILRDVEGMSVDEAAAALDVPPATVKTRHLRARRRLQEALAPELQSALTGTFPFAGADCEAMTASVIARIGI